MKKKYSLIILLLFVSFVSYTQEFETKKVHIQKIKEQLKIDSQYEEIYYYLINNYKPNSKLFEKEFYESDNKMICSFKRNFENNITYSISECKEAGGVSITVKFPKTSRKNIMNWITQIYEVNKMETDEHIWKENNSKFEPKEAIPGCYYKISETDKNTIVDLYCGC